MIMFLAGGLCLCAQERTITWTTDPVDGHRTGVVASNASNVEEAMGTVKGCTYYAPNGRKFRKGTVKNVARIMLDAQPAMAKVKTVIGHSTREMVRTYPECEIYDWYIDELIRATADSTGKRVDIGIANRGGVRIDMPAGEVLYDDIMSMFPFRNNLCYVALRGRDVRALLDQMAASTFQIVGGVKVLRSGDTQLPPGRRRRLQGGQERRGGHNVQRLPLRHDARLCAGPHRRRKAYRVPEPELDHNP